MTGTTGSGSSGSMLVIGDSLAVGARAPLASALPNWRIETNARTGRPLAEGMRLLAGVASPPPVIALSLFTNDDPGNVAALETAVRASVQRVAAGGCAIWATIVRLPVNCCTYAAANARLAGMAGELGGRMRLVPWAAHVAQHPEWMASDGVHATPAGYAARGRMFAEAAQSCSG